MSTMDNPMVAMMQPLLLEAFGETLATKEDVEQINIQLALLAEALTAIAQTLADIRDTTEAVDKMVTNAKAKGGMAAKMLGLLD